MTTNVDGPLSSHNRQRSPIKSRVHGNRVSDRHARREPHPKGLGTGKKTHVGDPTTHTNLLSVPSPACAPTLDTEMRRLLFTFDDNYLLPASVAVRSAIDHSPADVGILDGVGGLGESSRTAIELLCSDLDRCVEVIKVPDLVEGLPSGTERSATADLGESLHGSFHS